MKITFEGTVVRVYEETRRQRTNKYMVVSDKAEKYPDIFRFSLKQGSAISVAEGCQVKVTAYLHGREWANDEGKLIYFNDLNVDTVEVLNNPGAATATPAAAKPTTASNWNELLALGSAYGEDAAAVTNRCKATHPGKASNAYTAADWQTVANVIVAAHTPPPAAPAPDFTNDLPF